MWDSLNQAKEALARDGWKMCSNYWWSKTVSGRMIFCHIDARGPLGYWPELIDPSENVVARGA